MSFIDTFDEGSHDWVVEHENGIDWWPGELRMSFRFQEGGDSEDGTKVCWFSFFTEVADDADWVDSSVFNIRSLDCAMSGHVRMADGKSLMLGNAMLISSEEKDIILGRIFSLAVMQYREAEICAQKLKVKVKNSSSRQILAHPSNGVRREPSSFVSALNDVMAPASTSPEEDKQIFLDHFKDMSDRFKNGGWSLFSGIVNSGLWVELPFGDEMTSKVTCRIEDHALMGQGMRISQEFPIHMDTQDNLFMPLGMSGLEIFSPEITVFGGNAPLFVAGSFGWLHQPGRVEPLLNWSCFVPKFMIKSDLPATLKSYLDSKLEDSIVKRALYVAKVYTKTEITKEEVKRRRTLAEMLIRPHLYS